MAKREKPEKPEVDEEESSEAEERSLAESDADEGDDGEERDSDADEDDDADERDADESDTDEKSSEDDEEEDEDEKASDDEEKSADSSALAATEEAEDAILPTQLGVQRYVFAAYFAGGMVMAYVLGRAIHGIWSHYANRDFFVSAVPSLAAIPDDTKQTYATLVAALITLLFIVRTYRKPNVRVWTQEVTSELTKVKWPTRKEVTNSTIVVIVSSAIATGYLFLLDRLWAFVTNLVYGAGS